MPLLPLTPGTAAVIIIDPAKVAESRITGSLSPAEQEQAGRFRFEKDARHWRACRAALRGVLGEALGLSPAAVALEFGEFGKPRLAAPFDDLHFNLSHCHDLALIALCPDGPVGVDIEPADRASSLLGCESAFCHPDEMASLPDDETARAGMLLDCWTAKESLLKAVGTGFSLAAQSVSVAAPPESFAADPRFAPFLLQRLSELALNRHVACLAVPRSVIEVSIRGWPA